MRFGIPLMAAMLLVLLAVTGCAGESLPKTIRVRGRVTYKGQPLPAGRITFVPSGSTAGLFRPAQGTLREDGTYELSTFRAGDGALPGEYVVLIESLEHPASIDTAKIAPPPKSRIPERFANQTQTPLRAVVNADARGPLKLDFDLRG